MAADKVWENFLHHAQQQLSMHQFVYVVSAMAEVGAGLEELFFSPARS